MNGLQRYWNKYAVPVFVYYSHCPALEISVDSDVCVLSDFRGKACANLKFEKYEMKEMQNTNE